MPRITPNLWFDGHAEQAAEFYVAIFPDSRVTEVARYGPNEPGPEGTVMTVAFELDGNPFVGINGGPQFPHSEAVSFEISCPTQADVDYYWDALLADGGAPSQCGWLKDRFGLSWQVVPEGFSALLASGDGAARSRATQAMLKMVKLDIAELERAAAG
ncbi:MAG: VOC family protein [Patulibacter sp.]